MRLLLVNKFYPPDIGGVETVVAQYAQATRAAGHYVAILACHSSKGLPTQTTEDELGICVTRCRSWGTLWSMPIAPGFLFRYLAMYRSFDLIHFHEPFPLGTLAALATLGVRFVITWHSDIVRQRLVRPLFQFLQRLACRRAAVVMTTSEPMVEHSSVLRRFRHKIRVTPLSVPSAVPPATAPMVQQPYCLYLGRLAAYKGLDVLLEAIPDIHFDDHKLVISGDGPLRSRLQKALEGTEDRVVFIPRVVSEADKQSLLAHCSFLLFPSTAQNEAFGIVQLEAMAHGKPVINTRLQSGVPWVSQHGVTGLTVEPNDARALAGAINELLGDSRLRATLGTNARERVTRLFTDERVLPGLMETYIAVTSNASATTPPMR